MRRRQSSRRRRLQRLARRAPVEKTLADGAIVVGVALEEKEGQDVIVAGRAVAVAVQRLDKIPNPRINQILRPLSAHAIRLTFPGLTL
jgi:hypothetical protein